MKEALKILGRARQLESVIARGVTDAAKHLVRGSGGREPIELAHAIVDAAVREVQTADRGTRVFPFNTIAVSIAAHSGTSGRGSIPS